MPLPPTAGGTPSNIGGGLANAADRREARQSAAGFEPSRPEIRSCTLIRAPFFANFNDQLTDVTGPTARVFASNISRAFSLMVPNDMSATPRRSIC